MRKSPPHIAYTLIFLFMAGKGFAQATAAHGNAQPAVKLLATVDKNRILIGEPIQLMLEATVPGNAPLVWPGLDSLPHFEFIEKGKVDSAIHPDGRYYRQYLTITSFDSGTHAIPRLVFGVGVGVGAKKAFTDSVRVDVDFTKFDPKQDYHDIRDIIDIPNPYVKWVVWIVAIVTLASLALVIWLVAKKRQLPAGAVVKTSKPRLSPYEEAIKQLQEIAGQKAWENDPVKTYYTRLNDILCMFVLRRFGIASLAETNEELTAKLRSLALDAASFSSLAEALRMTDFVKFAKYQPAVSDNEHHFRVIQAAIEALHKIGNEQDAERERRAAAEMAAGRSAGSRAPDNSPANQNRSSSP
jgi:hypothetical protein